jgi:hypothetical protein
MNLRGNMSSSAEPSFGVRCDATLEPGARRAAWDTRHGRASADGLSMDAQVHPRSVYVPVFDGSGHFSQAFERPCLVIAPELMGDDRGGTDPTERLTMTRMCNSLGVREVGMMPAARAREMAGSRLEFSTGAIASPASTEQGEGRSRGRRDRGKSQNVAMKSDKVMLKAESASMGGSSSRCCRRTLRSGPGRC